MSFVPCSSGASFKLALHSRKHTGVKRSVNAFANISRQSSITCAFSSSTVRCLPKKSSRPAVCQWSSSSKDIVMLLCSRTKCRELATTTTIISTRHSRPSSHQISISDFSRDCRWISFQDRTFYEMRKCTCSRHWMDSMGTWSKSGDSFFVPQFMDSQQLRSIVIAMA